MIEVQRSKKVGKSPKVQKINLSFHFYVTVCFSRTVKKNSWIRLANGWVRFTCVLANLQRGNHSMNSEVWSGLSTDGLDLQNG